MHATDLTSLLWPEMTEERTKDIVEGETQGPGGCQDQDKLVIFHRKTEPLGSLNREFRFRFGFFMKQNIKTGPDIFCRN